MGRIGVVFQPSFPPERLRSVAEEAERNGVPELWLWEDCFRESGFASAAAALAVTSTLRVGIGVAPLPLRNVAITAMEIATIERMFPGRLLPGVGHGVQRWMAQTGSRVASPLTLMREQVPVLSRLLAGEEVTTTGRYVTLDAVRLDWPPSQPPALFAAGEGPKTLGVTGEVADGTVLTGGTSVGRLREAVELIGAGRSLAGRGGRNQVVVYLFTAFGGDDAAERMAAEFDDWRLPEAQRIAAVGDARKVADVAAHFFEAGADAVVLQPTAADPDLTGFVREAGVVASLLG